MGNKVSTARELERLENHEQSGDVSDEIAQNDRQEPVIQPSSKKDKGSIDSREKDLVEKGDVANAHAVGSKPHPVFVEDERSQPLAPSSQAFDADQMKGPAKRKFHGHL